MKQYIVRLISSKDHDLSKQEILAHIKNIGKDRYDPDRKQIFDDFYGKHKVDFFGTIVEAKKLNKYLTDMKKDFGNKTMGDREKRVIPDIALIYKATHCQMIQHVYEDRLTSDCFQFIGNAKDALEEVREL